MTYNVFGGTLNLTQSIKPQNKTGCKSKTNYRDVLRRRDIHDVENLSHFLADSRKYLCKLWLKSLRWFKSWRVHKISVRDYGHRWLTLTFEPVTLSMSSV